MFFKKELISGLGYLTKKFYCFDLRLLTQRYDRGPVFSMLLLLSKGFIIFMIAMYNQDYTTLVQIDYNLAFLNSVNYLDTWSDASCANAIQSLSLAINLIVFFYFLISYLHFILIGYLKYSQLLNSRNSTIRLVEVSEDDYIITILKKTNKPIFFIMSMFLSIYQYFLFVPLLYFSFMQFHHSYAPINIILTILIGIVLTDSDYCYSVASRDEMAKPFTPYNLIFFFIKILAILLVVISNQINLLLVAIYFLMHGWFTSIICPYYKFNTNFWSTFTYFYFGILSFTFFLARQSNSANTVPSFISVIYIPLFYGASFIYMTIIDSKTMTQLHDMFSENRSVNIKQVDRVIRLKLFQQLDSKKENDLKQLNIYSLIVKKQQEFEKINAQRQQTMTNSQYQIKMLNKELDKTEDHESCIKSFLKEVIRKISNKKGEEYYKFIYLVYLLDIMDCAKSYWVEFSEIHYKPLSMKQEQIIVSVHQNFLKQKIILQKSQGFNNLFDFSYYSVLNYEQRIAKLFDNFDSAMKQKVELLVLMKNKQIESMPLIKRVKDLGDIQKKIKNELNALATINNNNSDLLSLQVCYLETLCFSEKDLKFGFNSSSLYQNNMSQFNVEKVNSKLLANDQKKKKPGLNHLDDTFSMFDEYSIYDKNSCIIFASIDDGVNLILKKISNNFLDMFQVNPVDMIGKKLDTIMPTTFPIALKHKQYIANFFKDEQTLKNKLHGKVLFGQSPKGYVIPLSIDFRLNYCHQLQDIGFCAQLKLSSPQFDYMLFHAATLSYLGMTSNLQSNVFQRSNVSKKTDMGQFFPFLYNMRTNFDKSKLNMNVTNQTGQSQRSNTNGTNWEINTTQRNQEGQSSVDNFLNSNRMFCKDETKVLKYKQTIEFLLIVQNKRDLQSFNTQTTQGVFSNVMKAIAEKDYSYFLLDACVLSSEYPELDNLSFLRLSKIKSVSASQNGPIILTHLKENYELYTISYTKQQIDKIILDVETKYKKNNQSQSELKPNSIIHNQIAQQQQQPQQQQFGQLSSSQMLTSIVGYSKQATPIQVDGQIVSENLSQSQLDNLYNQNLNQMLQNQHNMNRINQEIINLGSNLKVKKEKIDEIVEEDQSISSVSALPSQNSAEITMRQEQTNNNHYENDYNQSNNQKRLIQQMASPIVISPKSDYFNQIKSNEDILSNNHRELQIMSDNNREVAQILSNSKLITNNGDNHKVINNERSLILEEEYKMLGKDDSLRQKPNFGFFSPLLSPMSPNLSMQELNKRNSQVATSNQMDGYHRKDSSFFVGQNSMFGTGMPLEASCSTAAIIQQQRFFQDRDSISFNAQNLNEFKESPNKQLSHHEKEPRDKRKKKHFVDQMDNQSSTKSRESSTSTKRTLISLIRAQTQILAIKIINVIGVLAFLTLASVTLQQYLSFMSTIQVAQDNLTVQSWPTEMLVVMYRIVRINCFVQLERQNNFTFASKQAQATYELLQINKLQNSFYDYNDQVDYMETAKAGFMLFDQVASQSNYFWLSIYYTTGDKRNTSSSRTTYYNELRNSTLLYDIVIQNYYINRMAKAVASKYSEFLVVSNLAPIQIGIENIMAYFQNFQNDQNISIQDQLTSLIAIILVISAVCLFMIMPLYGFIQGKKDLIIHLFCTFPTNQLHQMIVKIRQSYYTNKAMSSHIKHVPLEIQLLNNGSISDQSHLKKQTLSYITKLPRFNFSLLVILLFAYLLLSIYPIMNKILIQNFIDMEQNNLEMLQSLNSVREYIVETSTMSIFCLIMQLYPTLKQETLGQYIDQMTNYTNNIEPMLSKITFVTDQSTKTGRYQQSDFDNFFFPLFQNSICDLFANYTQFNQNATALNPVYCQTIQNGFLEQGFKLAFKEYTEILTDIYQILQVTDPAQLLIVKKNLFATFSIVDYGDYTDYLEQTLNNMKTFLITNSNDYFLYLQNIQLIIIIYQIILMALIFWIGWYSFSLGLQRSLTQTKQYLQVINIFYLLDNNYILTFVKNNHKL